MAYYESEFEMALLELLQEQGWKCSCGEDFHRRYEDPLIEEEQRLFLNRKYSSEHLSQDELDSIVANLRNTGDATAYKSLRAAFSLYRDGYNFQRHNSEQTLWINYIDFDNPELNSFKAVNQFSVSYDLGRHTRRPDILLFVNGIPVCILELKNPADENATISSAYDQIHIRYRRDIPQLMKFCALSCISDGSNTRLGTTYTPYIHYYAWKKVENEDASAAEGVPELKTMVEGAFRPDRLLEILRDYCYFPDLSKGTEEELVCRYPQFFATRKLLCHIEAHLHSENGDGKGGTYFGATGCGKTYTMVFLSRQLALRSTKVKNPTIVVIVDREDLQDQSNKVFVSSSEFLSCGVVRQIESREDLAMELSMREGGGVFICTIQKFCEATGLINPRANIICLSDEAHRSQTGIGANLRIEDGSGRKPGVYVSYGFAKYLRDAFPNATYVGFTGTPIDETIHVFGEVVATYTMQEAVHDNVTVGIIYEPRLTKVLLDDEKARQIEDYYSLCYDEGAKLEDILKSKQAMSSLEAIIGNDDRLRRLALDVAQHYEKTCATRPELVQKAMIACSNRKIAYKLYTIFREIRPEWFVSRKCEDESRLSSAELEKLEALPFINIVATRGDNDPEDMFKTLGDKSYRNFLAAQFKNEHSNFRIAIVVDMWITGFDVPCLTVLYNDKPLQKHNLIQTISRVNRKYQVNVDGEVIEKERGIVVDYIGIRDKMLQALKQYGGDNKCASEDEVESSYKIFREELQILCEMIRDCDLSDFFGDKPLLRLNALHRGAEFVLSRVTPKDEKVTFQTKFKGHVRRLRSAYDICHPAGMLSEEEIAWAQCLMAIYSYINKTSSSQHDLSSMNKVVEEMVNEAISCSGVEMVLKEKPDEEIFSDEFEQSLKEIKMPCTKFQVLVKLLKRAIKEYSQTNLVAAKRFEQMLEQLVEEYNTRDGDAFANAVGAEAVELIQKEVDKKVDSLSDRVLGLLRDLKADKQKFKDLGISFEEKAFYDILVDVRDKHQFEYPDSKCIELSRKIKDLVDQATPYADWKNNGNIKDKLNADLMVLLYKNGYPPLWNNDVYNGIMTQVGNYKENS